jgi:achaete-scute complex protein
MTIFETLWRGVQRDPNVSVMNSLTVIMPNNQQQQHQHVKPIAPRINSKLQRKDAEVDSTTTTTTTSTTTTIKPNNKRKIAFHPSLGYAIPPPIPPKVARRNARERNRVKQVNTGFDVLRSHIPTAAKHKKMSKVDTLRHAVEYIRNLKKMLKEQDLTSGIKTEIDIDRDYDAEDDFEFDDENSQQSFNDSTASNASSPPASTSFNVTTKASLTQNNFISQQQQQHSFPLTPRTPDSASDFTLSNVRPPSSLIPPPTTLLNVGNESGYETSNYYSQPSSLMSPDSSHYSLPIHHNQHHHQHHQHPLLLAPVFHHHHSPVNSVETSPSVFSDSSSFFSSAGHPSTPALAPAMPSNYFYTDCMEQNSEEDELLDAIVKWQED